MPPVMTTVRPAWTIWRGFSTTRRVLNNVQEPSIVEFLVGNVSKVDLHPNAENLYVSQIEIGEEREARTVCSGLVGKIPKNELQDSHVVLVANLKASKLRGIKSEAMVLAASNDSTVELVRPPTGAKPGQPVQFEGYMFGQAKKSIKPKVWQQIQPQLFVNSDGQVVYRTEEGDRLLTTEDGQFCVVNSLREVSVS
jgi:aminoacyl tRNA synthase complex-interacting multifunctional protein 1